MSPDPIDILARTIWGEARGDGRVGMEAVASVVLNRVADPGWWGRDIVSVCQTPWQFSCWNKNNPNREKLLAVTGSDHSFTTALAVADAAVTGTLADTTGGATSYYAESIPEPMWARGLTPTIIIGAQRFYRAPRI